MKRGRKTKFKPEMVAEVEKQLGIGMSRRDTMQIIGIAEETFYQYMKMPEFSEAVVRGEFKCKQRAILRIQKAMERSHAAAEWWLSRRYPDEFADRSKSEVTLKGGLAMRAARTMDLSRLSDSDLKALAKKVAAADEGK